MVDVLLGLPSAIGQCTKTLRQCKAVQGSAGKCREVQGVSKFLCLLDLMGLLFRGQVTTKPEYTMFSLFFFRYVRTLLGESNHKTTINRVKEGIGRRRRRLHVKRSAIVFSVGWMRCLI